jgi:hypothetical protein
MSESSSTSSGGLSGSTVLCLLLPFLLCGSGDANELLRVVSGPSFDVLCEVDVGLDPGAWEARRELFFSASRFSKVPRSVRPLSSSLRSPEMRSGGLAYRHGFEGFEMNCSNSPDNFNKLSILPNLFSSPSMYFALANISGSQKKQMRHIRLPLRRISLFLYSCENAFRLIIYTMRTRRHLSIALDLLLPTHIASLRFSSVHCASPLADL